ncbi:DUF2750 domain-containing protein [Actinokineospora enzanensis]|uniref:DUF2750 domain-containing protein n=1 Tax=Actinokineospora enzanensis TaxID=155975 RepID=UPI00037AA714|nr:DUF2750 domain-containing protein [Actinokineospora enzanensis]
MTTEFPLSDEEALSDEEVQRVWAADSTARRDHFFTTVATTGIVWAWDEGYGGLERDDLDHALVPLWPHRRLAEMSAAAMGHDPGPVTPIALDEVLDDLLEWYHEEGHEIAVLPTDGTFTAILSLERFRTEVFEARLRAAGLAETESRIRRDEFHADQRHRASRRLDWSTDDRRDLVARLADVECSDKFLVTEEWASARGTGWPRAARSLTVLGITCDCEARDYFSASVGQ